MLTATIILALLVVLVASDHGASGDNHFSK
jgi:hypothetical protein